MEPKVSSKVDNQVRETVKKILDLSKDRTKLKEERATAAAYKRKLVSGGTLKNELFRSEQTGTGAGRTSSSTYKRYVVDEEAYFNEEQRISQEGTGEGKTILSANKKLVGTSQTPYDKFAEPNLAKKLGLAAETDEDIVGKKDDPKRKKTKEEIEKEQDIAEVHKIINDGENTLPDLSKYMREEIDLLGVDISAPDAPSGLGGAQAPGNMTKQGPAGGGNHFGAKPPVSASFGPSQGLKTGPGFGNHDLLG